MKALHTIDVRPQVPERLTGLLTLAYDLWWSWNPEAVQLFRDVDPDGWESGGHNPVALLGSVQQSRLDELLHDQDFLTRFDQVSAQYRDYLSATTWYSQTHGAAETPRIVYLSAEFGVTECLPIYSGGLGILAGDHLKAASDLGLPLVGVGLLYQRGYFTQFINADGWQQERYNDNDFYNMPIRPLLGRDGQPIRVVIEFPRRTVVAQVWDARVGRVQLLLLDTNVPENSVEDRQITAELYGGDRERRIHQEIILGIGGIRVVQAMGWRCSACHLNEGHSAFSALERIRSLVTERQWPVADAIEMVRKTTIFTTHTPVPAGIDEFPEHVMQSYFGEFARESGLAWQDFMALGQLVSGDRTGTFNMMSLALNLSDRANSVSQLHGRVSRRMVERGWPEVPVDEIPIAAITNGVHAASWISQEMSALFDRHLGPAWRDKPADQSIWDRVADIPENELWQTLQQRRERLIAAARRRLAGQLERHGAMGHEIRAVQTILDPNILTVGFARRFAPYKRATLLLHDRDRLKRLIVSAERPVQFIFAGKAHPNDQNGKDLIREIVRLASQPELRERIVFLEDYEISLARTLVQGVDLWLNTPRRPMEACGTSGMKVLFNGGLNASILDGWWDEAYAHNRGWAIGAGEEYTDWNLQDRVEAETLYDLLEDEIIPLFYQRDEHGVPREWLARIKSSMSALCPRFNANRMICDYAERFYLPAIADCDRLGNDREVLGAYTAWKEDLRRQWADVAVLEVEAYNGGQVRAGEPVTVQTKVRLGALTPQDVRVEAFFGLLGPQDEVRDPQPFQLENAVQNGDGSWEFSGAVIRQQSGRFGYTVRVLPSHSGMTNPWEMRLVRWPSGQATA